MRSLHLLKTQNKWHSFEGRQSVCTGGDWFNSLSIHKQHHNVSAVKCCVACACPAAAARFCLRHVTGLFWPLHPELHLTQAHTHTDAQRQKSTDTVICYKILIVSFILLVIYQSKMSKTFSVSSFSSMCFCSCEISIGPPFFTVTSF